MTFALFFYLWYRHLRAAYGGMLKIAALFAAFLIAQILDDLGLPSLITHLLKGFGLYVWRQSGG